MLELVDIDRSSTELVQLVYIVSASDLKNLTISDHDIIPPSQDQKHRETSNCIQPLACSIVSKCHFTVIYLEITGCVSDSDLPVLTNIVQSHPTLEVLNIIEVWAIDLTELSLLVEAAINSQLKEIRVSRYDYELLPSHFREAHKQLLQPYTW